jgi:Fe-S oxidoreductase
MTDVVLGLDNIRNYAMQQDDLKDQVEIEILSPELNNSIENITEQIINKKPDMVGLSTYIWSVVDNIKLAEELKKRLPEVKIIFGGPQVSDIHWDIMQYTLNIDGVIRGEGEVTFSEMLRFWLKNGNLYSPDISGFSYRDITGGIVHNPDRPPIKNIDIIPFRYKSFEADATKEYVLETFRGCYNSCGYCTMGNMPFRKHSTEYILEEIDNMAKAGIKNICILDTSFTFNRRRMEQISRRLSDYGIRYGCCAEAEELDAEIMDILLETGAMVIEFGLQSTNPDVLALMKRKFNKDLFEKNINMFMDKCKGRDLALIIDIICGLPGDNLKTFCQSMDFAYSLRPHIVALFPLNLLPGTDFYINHEKYGFKFIPFTHEMKQTKSIFNLNRFGWVLENATFSKEELKRGHDICMFNFLLMETKFSKLFYNIQKVNGLTFMQVYNDISNYLPEDFYDYLGSMNDLEKIQFFKYSLREAFLQYDKTFRHSG